MTVIDRRRFLSIAASVGASAAWACRNARTSSLAARERRDLYPEGVASGDPDSQSVLLWTRRPFSTGTRARLRVQVSEDSAFSRVVSTSDTSVSAVSDWTCRVLVGNLHRATVYWYRFVDDDGNASRTGRTITAPADDDDGPIKFGFVSCQWISTRYLNAYRQMIADDERVTSRAAAMSFVLHLGDFAYKQLMYPEDNPRGYLGEPVREVGRFPTGQRLKSFEDSIVHVPASLEDYRTLFRINLHDPDLQDARARWPFVCVWDNGEFAWEGGYQSILYAEGKFYPAQTRKVMANQAWFEYMPGRFKQAGGFDRFEAPRVTDAPIERFDQDGFGDEPNNRAAVDSLRAYRALRWGRHLELVLTDQWSYRTALLNHDPMAEQLDNADFGFVLWPENALEILDAGRTYADGHPPSTIRVGDKDVPNFRKNSPPQTLLGPAQKAWLLERLSSSTATWKVWGSSLANLDIRFDLQRLPPGVFRKWPSDTYARVSTRDFAVAFRERQEIYDHVRANQIAGFATVSGDRHSFFAGYTTATLPPKPFQPVGVAFVTGSISSHNAGGHYDATLPKDDPLRKLYFGRKKPDGSSEMTLNLLARHGVRAALEYAESGDLERARAASNPDASPHLAFADFGGHGYAAVTVASEALACEFVCIPPPIKPDLAPVVYRVVHRTPLWKAGERPRLEQRVVEGNPFLSL